MKKLSNLFLSFLITVGCFTLALSAEAPRMSKEELRALLDHPDLVIIDVRYGRAWTESDLKIKGSVREDPDNLKSWVDKYSKDKTIVLY